MNDPRHTSTLPIAAPAYTSSLVPELSLLFGPSSFRQFLRSPAHGLFLPSECPAVTGMMLSAAHLALDDSCPADLPPPLGLLWASCRQLHRTELALCRAQAPFSAHLVLSLQAIPPTAMPLLMTHISNHSPVELLLRCLTSSECSKLNLQCPPCTLKPAPPQAPCSEAQ